ncbi:MAG: hypothetical protein ACI8TX_003074 [Hyphomicrobiaceae bacterium]
MLESAERRSHAGTRCCYFARVATRRSTKVMLVGGVLFFLGVGNAQFGAQKASDYRNELRAATEAGGPEIQRPYRGTESILHRPTDAELLYETASTKYAYYKLVRRGGRVFGALGVLLVLGSLLRQTFVPAR